MTGCIPPYAMIGCVSCIYHVQLSIDENYCKKMFSAFSFLIKIFFSIFDARFIGVNEVIFRERGSINTYKQQSGAHMNNYDLLALYRIVVSLSSLIVLKQSKF